MPKLHILSFTFLIALLLGYFVGVKWPSMGQSTLSKVGLS